MIFVIDTSTSPWVVAALEESRRVAWQEAGTGRPPLTRLYQERLSGRPVTRVAIATGPGSFTGTRVGVSFGLGLAVGLGVPIVPLPSLHLQSARSVRRATAVAEAGRGRVYFQAPEGRPAVADPEEVPVAHPLVGFVAEKTRALLIATGHAFQPEELLRSVGEAAGILLETAHEVPYRNLEIEYMHDFSVKR